VIVFGVSLLPATGHGEMLSIQNSVLTVTYDSTRDRFTLAERAVGTPALLDGRLLGAASVNQNQTGDFAFGAEGGKSAALRAQVRSAADAVFGKGRQIRVTYHDGSVSELQLYPKLPFLLIKTEVRGPTGKETDLSQVVPAEFGLDLGRPANELRTLGTAGLTVPDKNPGSYLFLTLAQPETRHGVVAGWLTQDRGSGVLFSSEEADRVRFRARIDYGHLLVPSGKPVQLETLAVGIFDDARIGEELYADAVGRQYHIRLHPQINGYCTWYSKPHGGAADEQSIIQLAETAARELKPFGFSFVQIDDKWQDGKERNGPARRFYRVKPDGPYPHGIKPVAEKLKSLGLTTGLWFLPFASDWQDPEFKDKQDWFVKRRDGSMFETAWGNTCLDLTHPAVTNYLAALVKSIHSWGVNYFKMDGLWTGTATEQIYVNDGFHDDHMGENAPFYDRKKTNIEALRGGLKLLRQAAGSEVFFSGCNLSQNMRSLAGSIGLVDSMRIGPDNGQGWRDYRREISENASGSIITGPVRGTRLYFMHGRFWWNDPDPCYVRASIPLNQAQLITSWVAISGQFNLNSDWLPGLPPERVDLLKRTMPQHGVTARPVDYFDTSMPGIWLVTDTRRRVRRDVLGLFNWDGTNRPIACSAQKTGLDPGKTYHAFDFWAATPVDSFSGGFKFDVPAQSCRVIAVRPAEEHPILVSTSRHVTQGIIDVTEEKWSAAAKTLSGTSQIVGNDPYELRIAGLRDGHKTWNLVSASVSDSDAAAGVGVVALAVRPNEEGWLRLKLSSSTSRSVRWALRFVAD
jgi:melibiase-like protein